MSNDSQKCTHPENLGGRNPKDCSPEQRKICHPKANEMSSKGDIMDNIKDKVEVVLNKIRPALVADGGNVELVDVKDGVVKVKLVGHCAGCPMSMMTLKNGIERMLKQEIPEVKQVVAA
jgi:Fe-S cluster biogenesis protein NfuA